jgi:hypothetical protein
MISYPYFKIAPLGLNDYNAGFSKRKEKNSLQKAAVWVILELV